MKASVPWHVGAAVCVEIVNPNQFFAISIGTRTAYRTAARRFQFVSSLSAVARGGHGGSVRGIIL
jgi:hypothetical protein